MKTVFAPDSVSAVMAQIQTALIENPVLGFAAVAIASAIFASWAAKAL